MFWPGAPKITGAELLLSIVPVSWVSTSLSAVFSGTTIVKQPGRTDKYKNIGIIYFIHTSKVVNLA